MIAISVKAFTLRLDSEMHRDLKTKAAIDGVTMHTIIIKLIAKELEREEVKQ